MVQLFDVDQFIEQLLDLEKCIVHALHLRDTIVLSCALSFMCIFVLLCEYLDFFNVYELDIKRVNEFYTDHYQQVLRRPSKNILEAGWSRFCALQNKFFVLFGISVPKEKCLGS